ncbi:MAG: PEP-CTERM sorting domain-containing protein [Gammaproteobacteria bacterium]|nr:PEP-CTERM sorting domain-containing protein [Gammaproteobacteria bacterium]
MKVWGLLALLILSASSLANAAQVTPGQYLLLDHPDGALFKSDGVPYGLRLDDQANFGTGGNGSVGAKTFSTQANGVSAILDWDGGTTATITGTLNRNSNDSVWDVVYTLTGVSAVAGANGGFVATAGSGTLTNGSDQIILAGVLDGSDVFRAFGDGHRLPGNSEQVARGWLSPNGSTNDWLVQLTPVPVPAALPLLISALMGFSFFSRRRRIND